VAGKGEENVVQVGGVDCEAFDLDPFTVELIEEGPQ
jgi:hypothetical protein